MTDQTPTPPAHNPSPGSYPTHDPHGNPYAAAFQQPATPSAPAAPPTTGRRSGWSWRAGLAGAVAGGVLAASVAVPITWALGRTDTEPAASAATQGQVQAPPGIDSSTDSDSAPQLPDQGTEGQFGYGGPGSLGGLGQGTSSREDTQTDATAEQSQGVVLIETTTTQGAGAGTGLVLDASGLVLTNYHVVEGSTAVEVTVATTGETYTATVLGHDQTSDIALLQLDGASGLATVTLDDDGDPVVSDEVTAVGNAEGQGYLSASTGTVVALEQTITTQSVATAQGERLAGLIQTDAYVVGGYSGGALLDDEGEVVGITTAASSGGATESYAIPIEDATALVAQIEAGEESGSVQIGASAYLGVTITENGSGVQVGQVQADGPAAAAGLQAGDTITGLDDTSIGSLATLRAALATYEPGDVATLRWTDTSGQSRSTRVSLAESPVS